MSKNQQTTITDPKEDLILSMTKIEEMLNSIRDQYAFVKNYYDHLANELKNLENEE